MEIKDLAGLSKPLCKLIGAFQDGCSWFSKPDQIKRLASATSEASSIEHITDFKKKMQQALLVDAIDAAHSVRERRQFDNVSMVYAHAAHELKMIDAVDSTPVDPDWSAYFFDYVKDVSDEEFQILWAKILAGEITSPNTYFKRTLFALKHIEKHEAKWLVEICSYLIDDHFICSDLFESYTYPYNQFQSLCDCGLFTESQCTFDIHSETTLLPCKSLSIKLPYQKANKIQLDGFAMTDSGIQISKLVQTETNREYMETLKNHIEKRYMIQIELV